MSKLIGMPDLKGVMVVLSAICPCEAHTTLMVAAQVGVVFGCPACRQTWAIRSYTLDTQRNIINVDLDKVDVFQKAG